MRKEKGKILHYSYKFFQLSLNLLKASLRKSLRRMKGGVGEGWLPEKPIRIEGWNPSPKD